MSAAQSTAPLRRITPRMMVDMINPGAVLMSSFAPALVGLLLAIEAKGSVSPLLAVLLLLIPCLMNASVDLLNDYYDYVRGNDTHENITSQIDGPLAYHQVKNPKPVLWWGVGFLVLAAVMGAYVVFRAGALPAIIGLVGGLVVVTYSGGHLPTSYLPIGEIVSGFTMGGLILLGVFAGLTGYITPILLYKAVPLMLVVSQFMLVNNTCDIERDGEVGRRTLPILIGRPAAQRLANVLNILWMVQMLHIVASWYWKGLPVLALTIVLFCVKGIRIGFKETRTSANKDAAVGGVALTGLGVITGYPLAIALHLILSL